MDAKKDSIMQGITIEY